MIPGGHDLIAATRSVIHLPGLRGNPERSYPVTAVGPAFPGPFEAYTASVLLHWQRLTDHDKLAAVADHAARLGLATKIEPRQLQASSVEVLVSRVARPAEGAAADLVKLHWFTQRGTDGSTEVTSADVDPAGAFGDWPEDFAAVDLGAQSSYLDASDRRRSEVSRAKKIPAARR